MRAGGRRAPQKEVVRVGGEATVLKHAKQVVVLPVDIPADLDRRFELQQSRLVNENLFALDNDELHLVVGELHRGARLLVPHCQQLFDDHVAFLIGHLRLRAPPPAPGPCAAHEREQRRSAACGGSTGKGGSSTGRGNGSITPTHRQTLPLNALLTSSTAAAS